MTIAVNIFTVAFPYYVAASLLDKKVDDGIIKRATSTIKSNVNLDMATKIDSLGSVDVVPSKEGMSSSFLDEKSWTECTKKNCDAKGFVDAFTCARDNKPYATGDPQLYAKCKDWAANVGELASENIHCESTHINPVGMFGSVCPKPEVTERKMKAEKTFVDRFGPEDTCVFTITRTTHSATAPVTFVSDGAIPKGSRDKTLSLNSTKYVFTVPIGSIGGLAEFAELKTSRGDLVWSRSSCSGSSMFEAVNKKMRVDRKDGTVARSAEIEQVNGDQGSS